MRGILYICALIPLLILQTHAKGGGKGGGGRGGGKGSSTGTGTGTGSSPWWWFNITDIF